MTTDDTQTITPVVILGQGDTARWLDDDGTWHNGEPPHMQEESK
jgi:hypothetical protein